jgi:hypothetical protein
MKIPPKGKIEVYYLSDTEFAAVQQSDSGQFWVTIRKSEDSVPGQVTIEGLFDDKSHIMFLNTVEDLKEYLLERADEEHKKQFAE